MLKSLFYIVVLFSLTIPPILLDSQGDMNINLDEFQLLNEEKLADGSTVLYMENEGKYIFIVDKKRIQLIDNNFPSLPAISPDRKRFVYITPHEWETIGDLYVYDIVTRKTQQFLNGYDLTNQNTPKAVDWLDDRYLLLIIGYAYGTITQGGSLYVYDMDKKQLSSPIVPEKLTEFKDIHIEKDKVLIDIVRWKDEQFTEFTIKQEVMNSNEILERVGMSRVE